MRDEIHDIDLHTMDAKTVCEVRLSALSSSSSTCKSNTVKADSTWTRSRLKLLLALQKTEQVALTTRSAAVLLVLHGITTSSSATAEIARVGGHYAV